MIKVGKQVKLNTHSNYKVVIGTVDNRNPKAIYATISAWVKPKSEDDIFYPDVIKKLNKDLKSTLFNTINSTLFDKTRTIIDLDMRNSGITYNKKSFMNCEITFFKINDLKLQDKKIKDNINNAILNLIENVFNQSEYFEFSKTKK
jgi:hypothetical protein